MTSHGPSLPKRKEDEKPAPPAGPSQQEVMAALKALKEVSAISSNLADLSTHISVAKRHFEEKVAENTAAMRRTYMCSKGLHSSLARVALSAANTGNHELKREALRALEVGLPSGREEVARIFKDVPALPAFLVSEVTANGALDTALHLLHRVAGSGKDAATALAGAGAVAALAPLLASQVGSTQATALLAIAEIAKTVESARPDLQDAGCVHACVRILSDAAQIERVRSSAAWALDCIFQDAAVLRRSAVQAAALLSPAQALTESDDVTVRFHGLALIDRVAANNETYAAVLSTVGLLGGLKAAYDKRKDANMYDGLYRVMENLRMRPGAQEAFQREGITAFNEELLKKKGDLEKMQRDFGSAFNMPDTAEMKKIMDAFGAALGPDAAKQLEEAMKPENLVRVQQVMKGVQGMMESMLGKDGLAKYQQDLPKMMEQMRASGVGGGMGGLGGAGGGAPGGFDPSSFAKMMEGMMGGMGAGGMGGGNPAAAAGAFDPSAFSKMMEGMMGGAGAGAGGLGGFDPSSFAKMMGGLGGGSPGAAGAFDPGAFSKMMEGMMGGMGAAPAAGAAGAKPKGMGGGLGKKPAGGGNGGPSKGPQGGSGAAAFGGAGPSI